MCHGRECLEVGVKASEMAPRSPIHSPIFVSLFFTSIVYGSDSFLQLVSSLLFCRFAVLNHSTSATSQSGMMGNGEPPTPPLPGQMVLQQAPGGHHRTSSAPPGQSSNNVPPPPPLPSGPLGGGVPMVPSSSSVQAPPPPLPVMNGLPPVPPSFGGAPAPPPPPPPLPGLGGVMSSRSPGDVPPAPAGSLAAALQGAKLKKRQVRTSLVNRDGGAT
jgi:hypothetical protein